MKKIISICCLMCMSLLAGAQSNEFVVNEPNSIDNQSISLLPRMQAAKQLIWVLPEDYWNKNGELAYECLLSPIINHFKSLGYPIRIYKYNGEYLPAQQMANDFPGTPKAKVETIAYIISGEKFYSISDLIIIPEIAAQGFNVGVKLKIYDYYQGLLWAPIFIAKGMLANTQATSIKNDAAKKISNKYKYNDEYEFVRRGYTTNWTLESFKSYAETDGLQRFEGIYQKDNQQFFVKKKGVYYYLVACGTPNLYLEGDIKGELTPTATPNIFLGAWNEGGQDDSFKTSTYEFNEVGLRFISGKIDRLLIKVWPTSNSEGIDVSEGKKWTGTGWSLKDGYVVTNHHVSNGAKSIYVNTPNGRFSAKVIAQDETNDLAVLYVDELNDVKIPYSVKSSMCAVGEDCFLLGYPMSSEMGDEIKLTTGVVSARSGYKGSLVYYQITAAAQPGNSGCPMFDKAGNVVGILNSGITRADNVAYAIKMSYLRTFLENFNLEDKLPDGTETTKCTTLPAIVECVKPFIYLLECSDTKK